MARDVFICHSSQDKTVADAVCAALESGGINCWIAPRDPVAGIPYARQITEAIDRASVVALVFSNNANRSEHVSRELEVASNAKKIVIPIRIEDVAPSSELQYYISRVHWFDAVTPPMHARMAELADLLRALLGKETPRDQLEGENAGPNVANNLPHQVTSFVGREVEVAEIGGLLQHAALVTLVGVGGIGKTRCAQTVGSEFGRDRGSPVWFVELARIEQSSLVGKAIASVLGVDELPGQPILETLLAALRRGTMLLILDNCEHVIKEAASVIAAILKECPGVRILATSQEALRVAGEHVFRVPALAQADAVALFADRVKLVQPSFAVTDENAALVGNVCHQLEGTPLAIELAAARMATFSLSLLAEKLSERFRILTGGNRESLPRHQALHATIDWSYDLLPECERALFRKLSVFSGGFFAGQALAVAPVREGADVLDEIDALSSLVNKSLLAADLSTEEPRYNLLESMRDYGREKLNGAGEAAGGLRAHAIAYANLAEELSEAWDRTSDAAWSDRVLPELENWRAALQWAFSAGGDIEIGQRLAAALRPVWFTFAQTEGRRWVRASLDSVGPQTSKLLIARLERNDAQLAILAMQYQRALESSTRALALFSEAGDKFGEAEARMFVGASLGLLARGSEGEERLQQALTTFRQVGARRWIAAALVYMGGARLNAGYPEAARPILAEALELFKEIQATRPIAHLALALAEIEFQSGDVKSALAFAESALAADRARGQLDHVVFDLCNLAAYLLAVGRWEEARSRASEGLSLARERGIVSAALWALQHLAAVASLRPSESASVEKRATAARVCGFVNNCLTELELRRDFTEQQEYEQLLRSFDPLGDHAKILFDEGREWNIERAAYEALVASAE